jgi:hypothetical protein
MTYSPVLAMVTAAFEIAAAVWVLRGPGRRAILSTTGAILLFLAGYQIIEVAICSAAPGYGFLPRLAFMAVSWLPPLGILLVALLLGPGARAARRFAYFMLAFAMGIVAWIAVDTSFASLSVCNAVYARYEHPMPQFLVYSGFYWLGLLGLVLLSAYGAAHPRDPHDGQLTKQILTGSVSFLVPAMITSTFVPAAKGALPSVMCHFAVLLAVFLVRLVHLERKEVQGAESDEPSPAFR